MNCYLLGFGSPLTQIKLRMVYNRCTHKPTNLGSFREEPWHFGIASSWRCFIVCRYYIAIYFIAAEVHFNKIHNYQFIVCLDSRVTAIAGGDLARHKNDD